MLYSLWKDTLSRCHGHRAIVMGRDVFTFADLEARLQTLPVAEGPVIARGTPVDILAATLRGWRDGVPVLPLEKEAPVPALPADIPRGTAHLKLTPGIAGSPRAVFFTAEQMAADASRIVAALGLTPAVPNLAVISLTHSYGYSGIMLPLLLHGIPCAVPEVPFPRVVAEMLARYPSVTVQAVPSMWKAWHRSGILKGSSIATAVSAGAPLTLELEHAVHESCGLKLHNFYGASECGGISYDSSASPRTAAGDLGTPLDGVSVVRESSGRLLVRSSSVAIGYQQTRPGEILGDGQFLTQDYGHIASGHVMLESSGAESINVAGRKIGPAKIESALLATGMVSRVRIFGVPSHDPERVEEITALIDLRSGAGLEQLRMAATERLAGWETPRHWVEADDESLWKLGRGDLRHWFPGR